MPRGDGTGPTGDGPLTGRGRGYCILRSGGEDGDRITGFAGVDGKRVEVGSNNASAYAPPSPKATDGQGKASAVALRAMAGKTSDASKKEVSQMPGGDGTGPMGAGPMTGRGAGYCAGNAAPGYASPVPGRGSRLRQGYGGQVGRGFGSRGGGRGRRNWFYATGMPGWARAGAGMPAWGGHPPYGAAPQAWQTGGQAAPTAEQELDVLKGQAEYFTGALEDIKKRIEELEAATKTD